MPNSSLLRNKPEIVVSETDQDRLYRLAASASKTFADVADALQSEMDRARVLPLAEMPANAVRMGSRVEFRSDAGHRRQVVLVFPGEADIAENKISILTPIGTSLIGLSTGQSISWTTRDGRRHKLTVLSVEQSAATTKC